MKPIRAKHLQEMVQLFHSRHGFNQVAIMKDMQGHFNSINRNFEIGGEKMVDMVQGSGLEIWGNQEDIEFVNQCIWELKQNEFVEYFVVNSDLGMSAGKIAAQVAHVATMIANDMKVIDNEDVVKTYNEWDNGTKVILEASEKEIAQLLLDFPDDFYYIIDEGRTEVIADSLTVIGLPPMTRRGGQLFIGHLNTLGYKPKSEPREEKDYTTFGRQICTDVWEVDSDKLNDLAGIRHHMRVGILNAGAHIISEQYHQFEPNGVTVLFLLSESHYSIHTYPEKGYCAIDCYTCGDTIEPAKAISHLFNFLKPQGHDPVYMQRGIREGMVVER